MKVEDEDDDYYSIMSFLVFILIFFFQKSVKIWMEMDGRPKVQNALNVGDALC